MDLPTESRGDVLIVRLSGRIDHANAESFREALRPYLADCSGDGLRLLFDLSELQYISSAGLRVLMLAAKQTRPEGGRIAMAAARQVVREVLDITRFNLIFPMYDAIDDAVIALALEPQPPLVRG